MLDKLSAPFPPEAIHWRAQNVTDRNGGSALALAYIDARDVMDRLDSAVGPANWATTYEETAKGRILCRLSLRIDGEWVMKTDGAGDTDVEGEKGAISDALKRAAVSWGVARYLYDLGNIWAPCELAMRDGKPVLNNKGKPIWKAWKPEAMDIFAKALASVGRPTTGPISDNTRDWISTQVQAIGKTPADLLAHLTPQSFKDFTYEQLSTIQAWIKDNRKAA